MEAKKAAKMGFLAAAAGAGAYFLFSKRCSPTRKQWSEFLKDKVKPKNKLKEQPAN